MDDKEKSQQEPSVSPMAAAEDGEKISVQQGEAVDVDLYTPLHGVDKYNPSERLLTARSLIVGAVLGSLVNCGNIYLGTAT